MALSNKALAKYAENPLTRDEALAEIERRNAVSVTLSNAAKAEANKVIHAFMGEVTTREALLAYIHINPAKSSWYGECADTHPLVGLREALVTYLKAEGLSLESHAMRDWLANN
jgi:hypothetical protein